MKPLKIVLAHALFHGGILWLLFNITGAVNHYLIHHEGNLFSYLVRHSMGYELPIFLLYIFAVECCYEYIFRARDLPTFILVCLAAGAFFTISIYLLTVTAHRQTPLLRSLATFFAIFSAYNFTYGILREFFFQRLHSREVRKSRETVHQQALKKQVDPHFLFNTLNYLYSSALKENAGATAEGIQLMAGMMRYMQAGMQADTVPLSEELAFIADYLKLQQLRLSPAMREMVDIQLDQDAGALHIAPLLLIPFIENAFQYGVSNDNPRPIGISIETEDSGVLTMRVTNADLNHMKRGSGKGIELTRQRLQLLYARRHSLTVERTGGMFDVTLIINLR